MERHSDAARRLAAELPAIDWVTDPQRVARLSQDFAWFSPVLKRQLADKRADIAVRPRTEEEIRQVVGACAKESIPITVRGSGTGNYGQSVPLHGGVVLDLSGYNAFGWVREGVGRAQAGIRLAEFDRVARPQGHELRWLPSTFRSATLGGLFGGGFGGAGSINYGPVAAIGNVLGVRAMTVEPSPQIVELRSPEAMLLHHTYGCNGIVLELEVALAPAVPWSEWVASFDDFDAALDFAHAVSASPGIAKKEICLFAAPVPALMSGFLAEALQSGEHAVLMLIAPSSEEGAQQLLMKFGGRVSSHRTAEEVASSHRTLLEYTWNHTTLVALKADKTLTYIQSAFDPSRCLEQVRTLRQLLGDEVLVHLEFLRNRDGALTCSGLQLIRYSSDERLQEIMAIHRSHGVTINDPHVFIIEDGKQAQMDPKVIEVKRRFDPNGLLNPGKLRSWVDPGG